MEHDIPFGNSNRENGTTFLDFPLFLGIFQWDEPTKRVPFTDEPEIPEILTKWKAPGVYDQMEQLFTNRKFHFCYHRNFRVFFPKWKAPLGATVFLSSVPADCSADCVFDLSIHVK